MMVKTQGGCERLVVMQEMLYVLVLLGWEGRITGDEVEGRGGGVVGGKTGRKPDLGDYREDLLQVPLGGFPPMNPTTTPNNVFVAENPPRAPRYAIPHHT